VNKKELYNKRLDYPFNYPFNSRTDRYKAIYEDRGNWGRCLADSREEEYRARECLCFGFMYREGDLSKRKGRGYFSLRLV
jgi:hypothetical protein